MSDSSRRSTAVVEFVASLMPVYIPESGNSISVAICLESGTRVSPIEEYEGGDVWVRLSFVGAENRELEVQAEIFAGLAISRYVALTCIGASEQKRNEAMHHFAQHLHFKTGVRAYLPNLPDPEDPTKQTVHNVARWVARVAVGSL